MGKRVSELLRGHYMDPGEVRRRGASVLVWREAPPPKLKPELLWVTQGAYHTQASGNDPLVLWLEKDESLKNAFPLGITLGRTANNDLTVDHPSVSRFHAYFQKDPHSGIWHVVDAESSNGTFVEGVRLQPGRPAPLADGGELKVGSAVLEFMNPERFERFLDSKSAPRPQRRG